MSVCSTFTLLWTSEYKVHIAEGWSGKDDLLMGLALLKVVYNSCHQLSKRLCICNLLLFGLSLYCQCAYPWALAHLVEPLCSRSLTLSNYSKDWYAGLLKRLWMYFLGRHIAASCPVEPLCRNCKKPGHIASECRSEPICNSCGKPGHLAKGCAAQEGGIPKAWLCNNCYRPGHLAVDCPNEKACNNCRQPGHLARDCLNSPVCNSCSQPGHIARDCPLLIGAPPPLRGGLASSFNPSEMICHNCHQRGHKSKECQQVVHLSIVTDVPWVTFSIYSLLYSFQNRSFI